MSTSESTANDSQPLWQPADPHNTATWRFMDTLNSRHGLSLSNYEELYNWLVKHVDTLSHFHILQIPRHTHPERPDADPYPPVYPTGLSLTSAAFGTPSGMPRTLLEIKVPLQHQSSMNPQHLRTTRPGSPTHG